MKKNLGSQVASTRTATALVALCSVAMSGCAFFQGLRSSNSSGSSGAQATTYTFENRSTATLCEVWLQGTSYESYGRARHSDSLAPGASVQLSLRGPVQSVFATECGSARTLIGGPDSNDNPRQRTLNITTPRIVLFDAGEAPASTEAAYALETSPSTSREWIDGAIRMLYAADSTPDVSHDPQMASEALERVRNFARRQGWTEQFFTAVLTTDGWVDTRGWRYTYIGPRLNVVGRFYDALLGARWNDGHCTMQSFRFSQRGDGDNYEAQTTVGMGPQIPMPCAIVDAIANEWEGAAR